MGKRMDLSGNPWLSFGSDSGHQGTRVLFSPLPQKKKEPGSVPNKPLTKLRAVKCRYYTQLKDSPTEKLVKRSAGIYVSA